MEILHVSAECYPVAKAGGLGDVVGVLPKYQNKIGHTAKVVMPMYRTKFLYDNEWELVHEGSQHSGAVDGRLHVRQRAAGPPLRNPERVWQRLSAGGYGRRSRRAPRSPW